METQQRFMTNHWEQYPMKNLKVPLIVSVICIVVAVGTSPAGIHMPQLNPFAKKQQDDGVRRFREPEKKSLIPTISLFPKRNPTKPSTFQKINRNTKTFFAKTADFLNPFNDGDKMPSTRPNVTGSRRTYSGGTSYSSQEDKKPSFLARLIPWGKSDPEPHKDVNSFLSQPRPVLR